MAQLDEPTFRAILEGVNAGEPVRKMLDRVGISCYMFYKELADNYVRSEQYARAKQSAIEALADDILAIADDATNDWTEDANGKAVIDHEHIQRSRLRVDSRKWLLSKLAPKKYGESSIIEVGNKDGRPLETTMRVIFGRDA